MKALDWLEGFGRDCAHRLRDPAEARYIVSYPKAGITWLRYMLAQTIGASYGIAGEGQTVDLEEFTAANPAVPFIIDAHDQSEVAVEADRAINARMLFAYSGRVRFKDRKVLFLIRDPRDVVVSYYHQATKRSGRAVPVKDLPEFIRHPVYGFARIVRFHQLWAARLDVPSHYLVVRYEDLRARGADALLEVARFLGIAADLSIARRVFENSSADKMRAREIEGVIAGMRVPSRERDHLKVRKARVRGFADEMSIEDQAFCAELMRQMPAPFDYAP